RTGVDAQLGQDVDAGRVGVLAVDARRGAALDLDQLGRGDRAAGELEDRAEVVAARRDRAVQRDLARVQRRALDDRDARRVAALRDAVAGHADHAAAGAGRRGRHRDAVAQPGRVAREGRADVDVAAGGDDRRRADGEPGLLPAAR